MEMCVIYMIFGHLCCSYKTVLSLFQRTSSNEGSTCFSKFSSRPAVCLGCVRTPSTAFCSVNVRRGHAQVARTLKSPVSSRRRGDGKVCEDKCLRLSATVKEKAKRCFMRLWPERGSTYCQENVPTASDEFKEA